MIYTQETLDEVAVTIQLVVDAYNYIAEANLDPADFDRRDILKRRKSAVPYSMNSLESAGECICKRTP